ncbi:hypothetical protein ACH4F6_21655 [Streptomyces sp. NPDC017936]|uniref:hypothetical protein n=1 Tax=Streptomyces sp. NPDC017936 TaxID=3365016 RepID=UPI0037BC748C
MGHDRGGRGGTPSIHRSALDNLRRGARPVLLFLAGVFGLMALFVGGGMFLTWRSMPTVPTGTGEPTGVGASATPGAPASDARRAGLVAFLTDAVREDGTRWFPGSSADTDGLTYTPLSPGDPGGGRPDGLARVSYHDLPATDVRTVLAAVSRNGGIDPSGLTVVSADGADEQWTLRFTVPVRGGGDPLAGEAEGYTTSSGASVILRLVYPRA